MVIRPWGYGIWELIQRQLDDQIRRRGHQNVYFPLFIPISYLQKEAEHVEGFAKEMAVVTHRRLESVDGRLVPSGELQEPLVVRPTSETLFGESLAEWIQSYRDLPVKLNQWANVVRWEMRPRVFLRTTEFLWQEGHTAHAIAEEAMEETLQMHRMYQEFAEQWLAIPVIPGEKPPSERFPGALRTFTIEAMMQDGRALQAGTSHYLGQNFARAAGIEFLDADGERRLAYTTSWGVSTRLIGAVIMSHGDDDGLSLPPTIAPQQVVVIPLVRGTEADAVVLEYARRVADVIEAGARTHDPVRVMLDDGQHRPVDKKWKWIKRGVPLLVEVGARDAEAGVVSFRSRLDPHRQRQLSFDRFPEAVTEELASVQSGLFERARKRTWDMVRRDVRTRADAERFLAEQRGFVLAGWCGSPVCEVALKPQGVTIRCLPTDEEIPDRRCLICGAPAEHPAVFGLSY